MIFRKEDSFNCLGAIINELQVVSAAHCFQCHDDMDISIHEPERFHMIPIPVELPMDAPIFSGDGIRARHISCHMSFDYEIEPLEIKNETIS